MVKTVFLLLFTSFVMAGTIHQKIADMIGEEKFLNNITILNAIFLKQERFKKEGMIDVVEVASVLKRLGFIPPEYSEPKKQSIIFYAYNRPNMLLFLFERALNSSAFFDYTISKIAKDEDGIVVGVNFVSKRVADPSTIGRFFQKNGVKVLSIKNLHPGWKFTLDLSTASLALPKVEEKLDIDLVRKPIWIKVEDKNHLSIVSKRRNHWFAKVALYDQDMKPVTLIEEESMKKRVNLTLPKGIYYIKISDRFTLKNIKYGFSITAR